MLIIPLLFFGSIYWMIARCYVQIGKNVNHPSPGMAYFLIVPLVLPVYVAQLARVKGMKFGIVILLQVMMLLVGILSSQFTNKSIDRALEIQAEGRVVEQRIKADLGEDLSLQKLLEDPEFKSLNDELVEISTTKNPWRALSSILALLNLFYMSYLLLLATKMNMIHLLWNLIPLLGFFILFCLVYRASFHVTNDDEAVDPQAIFNDLPDNEKKVTLQIVEALKAPIKPTEAVIMTQLQTMGIDPGKAELITALAFEVDKLNNA